MSKMQQTSANEHQLHVSLVAKRDAQGGWTASDPRDPRGGSGRLPTPERAIAFMLKRIAANVEQSAPKRVVKR